MDSNSIESAPAKAGILKKIFVLAITNAVTRIIVGFAVLILAIVGCQETLKALGMGVKDERSIVKLLPYTAGSLIISVVALGTYALFVRVYEKRWPCEIGPKGFIRWNVIGFVIGIALMVASWGSLRLGGWMTVEGVAPQEQWAGMIFYALAGNLVVACMEELLVRGILFRIVEEVMGTWFSLALSAILFGLMHLGNPNANWETSLAIALEAGILLGALYVVTRSLWMPIAVHWAWNSMQQGVIGGALSGNKIESILTSVPVGPEQFSGGAFGIEGSAITTMICASVGLICCVLAVRQQKTIKGRWLTKRVANI